MPRKRKIRTIDVNAKEWFDKVNGNSYFSAVITINFGIPGTRQYAIPFQYGYGDHYVHEAKERLINAGEIACQHNMELWRYCRENNIVLRTNKEYGCKQRDVKQFTEGI